VVIVTTEMPEYDVMVRCLANLTNRKIDNVEAEAPTFRKAARKMADLGGMDKYLRIVRIKPGSPVTQVRSVISRLEAVDGVKPDLVVVDYADELRAAVRTQGGSEDDTSYAAYGNVYAELIAVGVDWSCPVWTGCQLRRQQYGEDTPGLEGVADSLKKAQMAHLVVSIGQTDTQEATGGMGLYVAKHRGGRSKLTINLKTDFARCRIRQKGRPKDDEEDGAI
jgi:replicative DNA helicase